MNDPQRYQQQAPLLADLHRLLRNQTFASGQSHYLETERVALFINPCARADSALLDIPIHIQLIGQPKTLLHDVPLFLHVTPARELETAGATLHYGRLDKRGTLCFAQVATGSYRLTLPQAPGVAHPAGVVPLVSQQTFLTPAAQSAERPSGSGASVPETQRGPFRRVYQSSSGLIKVIVLVRETGEFTVTFHTPYHVWDGSILQLHWYSADDQAEEPGSPEIFLVVLTWSQRHQRCIAEINVGRVIGSFTVALPEAPEPVTMLEAQSFAAIQRSTQAASTHQSRRAWQQLLTNDRLSLSVRQHIEQALHQ